MSSQTVIGSRKKPNYRPLGDFVLLDPLKDNVTPGGLALPDGVSPNPPRAVVVSCGPGRVTEEGITIPPAVEEGDVVMLAFAGHSPPIKITMDGHEYVMGRSRDLIAVMER